MSRLAVEHDAVNLGQGFPDFDGPGWIIEEAYAAMKGGRNQYAPMSGTEVLRGAVSSLYRKCYSLDFDPAGEITVSAGATESLFSTILALVGEGDEVILFEPFYDAHQADVLLAGGVPRYVTLRAPGFDLDPEELERAVTPRTKLIILNNPQNPTGKVFTQDELASIARVAREHDLLLISDEVYEFLTYDGAQHLPIAALPGMRDRTVTISSTGKTFGMTGWKIGYAAASRALTEAIRSVHQWVTFAVNTPGQYAMAHAIGRLEEYLPDLRASYERKRKQLYAGLLESPFRPHLPSGSYFIMADIPPEEENDVACAEKLVTRCGVAAIPPSVFYERSGDGKRMIRFCFAKREETLAEGIRRLKQYTSAN